MRYSPTISVIFYQILTTHSGFFSNLKWAIPGLFFLYFFLFNTVDSKQMFNKFCQWLDSNRGPLVWEVTALPTKPQPLPFFSNLCFKVWVQIAYSCSLLSRTCELFLKKTLKRKFYDKLVFPSGQELLNFSQKKYHLNCH